MTVPPVIPAEVSDDGAEFLEANAAVEVRVEPDRIGEGVIARRQVGRPLLLLDRCQHTVAIRVRLDKGAFNSEV